MADTAVKELFKIKFPREVRGSFEVGKKLPSWSANFENLVEEYVMRKSLFEVIGSIYDDSSLVGFGGDFEKILDGSVEAFEKVSSLRTHQLNEAEVSYEALMLVSGIKIFENLAPHAKSRGHAASLYDLYLSLWKITEGMLKATRYTCDFWDKYFYKIGMYWLVCAARVKASKPKFFRFDDEYGLHLKDLFTNTNPHESSWFQHPGGGSYLSLNPITLLTVSAALAQAENVFVFDSVKTRVTELAQQLELEYS